MENLDKQIKIETVADYNDHSAKTVQFCKDNLEAARNNPALASKARTKIRAKLLEGIEVEETDTGNKRIRKFDYPVQYISNALKIDNRTTNKWVILCALNYEEKYEEGEDPTLLAIKLTKAQPRRRNPLKKSNKKDAIAKRTGLVKK